MATIDVGGEPAGIARGAGFAWVADATEGTVDQIDPGANRIVGSLEVGNGPRGVAVAFGAVWVLAAVDGEVVRIDLARGEVTDRTPGGLEADRDRGRRRIAMGHRRGRRDRGPRRAGLRAGCRRRSGSATARQRRVRRRGGLGRQPRRRHRLANRSRDRSGHQHGRGRRRPERDRRRRGRDLGGERRRRHRVAARAGYGRRSRRRSRSAAAPAAWRSQAAQCGRPYSPRPRAIAAARCVRRDAVRIPVLRLRRSGRPTTSATATLASLAYDGLTAYRRVGGAAGSTLVANLATDVPEPEDDGLTYVFELRPDLRFSDGTEVEPEDFRSSIERMLRVNATACPSTPLPLPGHRRAPGVRRPAARLRSLARDRDRPRGADDHRST